MGIAGTKAFYADTLPKNSEEFARNRHLLQLNTANALYPDLLSIALKKDTKGAVLDKQDLDVLIRQGNARIWVGARAVAYDGFPTLGVLYSGTTKIQNARVTTHLGSGGVSFAHGVIDMSKKSVALSEEEATYVSPLAKKVIRFSDARR